MTCFYFCYTYNYNVEQVPMHHPTRRDPIPFALQPGKILTIHVSIVLEEEVLHK